MKLKHKQLVSWCAEAVECLTWVGNGAGMIADRANADMDDGLKGRSYDGDGRGSAELTQPERWAERALRHGDVTSEQAAEFIQAVDDARRAALRARKLAGRLIRADDQANRDREAASAVASASRSIGAGYCVNCNHYCAGTANDRLRSGRCDPCRRYRERHHGMDRPRELWGDSVELEETPAVRGDGGTAA